MVEIMCSTTLFTVGTFPMNFVLEETNENQIVAQMIRHGGGCIVSSKGPYGICLSSPEKLVLLPNEAIFSTEFIKECCKANRILDINQFRLSGPSSYPNNFNIMKILLRQSHWPTSAERNENESANSDSHSDSHVTMESQSSKRNVYPSQRRIFTENDEKEILCYIVENKEIGLILGNTIWKKMAQRKVCQGQSWQSLKKQFLKHILPNIKKYTFLSVTDRLEFQKHLHLTEGSVGAGSSSTVRNQSHVEEHRSDRLPRLCESPVSNGSSSNLARECGRRLPEKRKPFQMSSVDVSSESDSDGCDGSRDDQRLQDRSKFNTATSSRVHHKNKGEGDSHSKKQGNPQHPEEDKACNIQREQSVINSSDKVDSGSEQPHKVPVVQRTDKEGRQSPVYSSSDDWFMEIGQDQQHRNSKANRQNPRKLRKRRREEFTMEEEYAILDYLQKHNRFSNTGGNNVWKNMAATEPMGSRHTWHSLRERYLKKIVPNIAKYNMPEEIVRRIKYK